MSLQNFDTDILRNPLVFEQNRLPAHSDHIMYNDEYELAVRTSSLRYSLNGIWKFRYAPNPGMMTEGFEQPDYDCMAWDDIRVPAHIQMEGYDAPHYTNVTYPWETRERLHPGELPKEFNPVAEYIRYFTVPSGMLGKRLFICFAGAESGIALWLNGHYVGYAEDSFDSSEFELTEYLTEGENKLAVRVFKWTSSSWCEDQDFFRFSGLYRDVYLYAAGSAHIEDIKLRTKAPSEGTSGASDNYWILRADIKCLGAGSLKYRLLPGGVRRTVNIMPDELNQKPVAEGEICFGSTAGEAAAADVAGQASVVGDGSMTSDDSVPAPGLSEVSLGISVSEPLLWSSEIPNLYTLIVELYDAAGSRIGITSQFVGFRHFELKNGLMLLNGERIVFKGVNRHEFNARRGRVPSTEDVLTDLTVMKKHNINAIRTSHYPDAAFLYEACDVFGIYLIAENNMESHGQMVAAMYGGEPEHLVPGNNADWQPMMLGRVRSCYENNKNHPAVLIWSCGNESLGGSVIYEMTKLFKSLDPDRLVHYEGICHDRTYNETSDMESQMYPPVAGIKAFLKDHPEKPFLLCEYSHAMGNSCGGIHKYTDLTVEEPRYQGGFIWDYIDQTIIKKNRFGEKFTAYGGDFGDRPNDGDFCGDGIVYGDDRMPSPKMQEVKACYSNIDITFEGTKALVVNRNLFASTGDFDAVWSLKADGVCVLTAPAAIELHPGEEGLFEVPSAVTEYMACAEASLRKCTERHLPEWTVSLSFRLRNDTIWAGAGHEIAYGEGTQGSYCGMLGGDTGLEKPVLVRGQDQFVVKGRNFRVMLGYSGGMKSYVYAGREMLPNTIPVPNFWRAPSANDRGNLMQSRYGQWKVASLYLTTHGEWYYSNMPVEVSEDEVSYTFTYTYRFTTKPDGQCRVSYRVFGDGTVETGMYYDPVPELGDMPEFGMMFKLDAELENLKWYGLGPEETYADRLRGGRLGVFTNKVADNMARYLTPQECGNKCGVRYAELTDDFGQGIRFEGDAMSFSALPYTPHQLEEAAHTYELPPVHYTVARVALAQMGVGGDDSWGARVHPEYLNDVTKPMEFKFRFRGI